MELKEVETSFGVPFPQLFHAIEQSGMMDYLIRSKEWLDHEIANNRDYMEEEFFGESMGDCRMIPFEKMQSAYDELYECLNDLLEIYPERQSINPQYRLVPFARMISGDLYCFLYGHGEEEPKVVVFGHDTGDVDLWAENFEEFVYFQIVEEAAEWEHDIHSDYIKAHILWLNDAHQQLLAEVVIRDILEQLPEPEEFNIWI